MFDSIWNKRNSELNFQTFFPLVIFFHQQKQAGFLFLLITGINSHRVCLSFELSYDYASKV